MAFRDASELLNNQKENHFENPLEKIEQLLTCPICLDRYKFVFIKN